MFMFEDLMDRRPLLLNSVLLRQNPHNVVEWQKRWEINSKLTAFYFDSDPSPDPDSTQLIDM